MGTGTTPTGTPLLAHLTVVELAGDPAGEVVGKLLAQLGADVIKVEPPSGSPTRSTGPYVTGSEDHDHSLAFWYYNTGKRSVVLDHGTERGREDLLRLVAGADIVVTTLRPSEAAVVDLSVVALREASPQAVVVSVTPFGLDGPWADRVSSDLVGLALGGPLNSCGYDDHTIPPIRPGGDQGFQTAASFAQMGLMLALIERERSGEGQVVDVSMHDALAVGAELANPYWFYPRVLVHRQTCRHAQPTPTQPAIFQCGDGRWVYYVVFVAEDKGWQGLVSWLESRDLAVDLVDPAYLDPGYRQANFGHIQEVIETFFLLQTADEAYLEGQARGMAIGPINAPDDLFHDEHLAARQFFVEVEHADVPPALYPSTPMRFSAVPTAPQLRAPNLGEHTGEVLGSLVPEEVSS